ncbi:MAG TPA: hypothetical protein VN602_08710, partial [Gemmatimonadaceae bacterium]|nr:hypothetical protein [Gemmatimonadaceae bacterium]
NGNSYSTTHRLFGYCAGRVNRHDFLELPTRRSEISSLGKGVRGDVGPYHARGHHLTIGELFLIDCQLTTRPTNNHVVDRTLEVTRIRHLIATIQRVKLFGFQVSPEKADYDNSLRSRGENLFVRERQSLWSGGDQSADRNCGYEAHTFLLDRHDGRDGYWISEVRTGKVGAAASAGVQLRGNPVVRRGDGSERAHFCDEDRNGSDDADNSAYVGEPPARLPPTEPKQRGLRP